MNFAVGFDLRLPQNLMEPMLRKLSAIRFVQVYITTSNARVSMVRNYYHFKDLEVVFSSNWHGWLERAISPFCKTLRINHTRENDGASGKAGNRNPE